ncbi:MAG: DUF2723 domain-containing protein [Ignavibacteriales bacterium]|nr:DUF2723 domain-containing protein [Ignavibacteriales bacterium]
MFQNKKEFFLKYYSLMTGLLVAAVYLLTMAPSVIQIDSGELASVQATLGIAHPTGYPLFTIIGYFFLKLPLPFTKIFQANLLALVWCTLGVLFFTKSAFIILSNIGFEIEPQKKKSKSINKSIVLESFEKNIFLITSAVLSGLILAFSKTYWSQSTSVEVYSLQIFLFALIIFSTLHAYYSEHKLVDWIWVALSLALGFSNHMTTLLTLPFVAILFFQKEKFNAQSIKKILLMVAVFFPLVITFYLYLPLRASSNPKINWGNPVNFENLFRHVSGKQYQVWLFASMDAAEKQLGYFLRNFASEFGYFGALLGLIGIFYVYKYMRKMFYALIATFIFSVMYSINYDIVDIDSYFLLAYIIFSFFAAFGILKNLLYLKHKFNTKTAIVTSIVISLFPLMLNFSNVDQSGVYTFEDYTKAVLNNTEKNSIIFSYQWDYLVSPSYYFQTVENFRKDVCVIDKELLRRSWYYNQLKRNHQDVLKTINSETNNFIESVLPFERDEKFDPNVIETSYRSVMTNLVAKNIEKRNFYIGLELLQNEMQRGEFTLPVGYQIIPHLLMFKVAKGNDYVSAPDPNFTIRFPSNRNKYIDFIETTVATMLTYRAAYELQFNKPERAKVYLDKVRKDFPNYQIPYDIENRIR